ncbi:hypothetical protein ACFS07_02435 [Undibacterium arcticum]
MKKTAFNRGARKQIFLLAKKIMIFQSKPSVPSEAKIAGLAKRDHVVFRKKIMTFLKKYTLAIDYFSSEKNGNSGTKQLDASQKKVRLNQ